MPNPLIGFAFLAGGLICLTVAWLHLSRAYRKGGKATLKAYIVEHIGDSTQYRVRDSILLLLFGLAFVFAGWYLVWPNKVAIFGLGFTAFVFAPYLIFSFVFYMVRSIRLRRWRKTHPQKPPRYPVKERF